MKATNHRCELTGIGAGEQLRVLRIQAGITQAQLAVKLGTTQSAVARFERGLHRTSLESINRVATALGCETALLIEQKQTA